MYRLLTADEIRAKAAPIAKKYNAKCMILMEVAVVDGERAYLFQADGVAAGDDLDGMFMDLMGAFEGAGNAMVIGADISEADINNIREPSILIYRR